jgi:hypothetical protein
MARNIGEMLVDTIIDVIQKHPAFEMIGGGGRRLVEAGMKPMDAWRLSRASLVSFLKDEGVKFGDPAYAWDAAAGATLVEEYELQYWEG